MKSVRHYPRLRPSPVRSSHRLRRFLPVLAWGSLALSAMAQISLTVQLMSTFSDNGDGWLTPAENGFLTTGATSTERGLAFNPTNNHLYITSRGIGANTSLGIQILDGSSAAVMGNLSTAGISGGGGGALNMISVSSDGVVYAGNLSTNTTSNQFKLYRWATEFDTPAVVSVPVGGLSAARTGDTMDIIGSDLLGTTRIAVGYNTSPTAGYAVLDPINLTATSVNVGTAMNFRGGVTWVDEDTVWGIAGGTVTNGLSRTEISGTLSGTMNLTDAGERPLDMVLVNGIWLLATVEVANNTTNNCDVRIYDVTDSVNTGVATRTLLGTYNLVSSPFVANANAAGAITWGAVDGNDVTLYALSANNGLQAFDVHLVPEPGSTALCVAGTGWFLVRRRRASA